MDNFQIEYEDVVVKMLVQTLEGNVRLWYKSIFDASIMDEIHFNKSSQKNGATNRTLILTN